MTRGDRIKIRRESLGITQTALADKIGVTKQQMYKYENGVITNIPSDKIEAIAEAIGVTPAYLMGWEESPAQTVSNSEPPAFFRLRKGLEPYDISEADADYLVEMYKLHLKMNSQEQ